MVGHTEFLRIRIGGLLGIAWSHVLPTHLRQPLDLHQMALVSSLTSGITIDMTRDRELTQFEARKQDLISKGIKSKG